MPDDKCLPLSVLFLSYHPYSSSPAPIPKTLRAISAHAVCEPRQTARLTPQNSATFFSSSFVFDPVVIHPDFNASATCSISNSPTSGGENDIFIFFPFLLRYTI
jgi:hypothetical protein